MSVLTGRYTGSTETAFDIDIRQITSQGLEEYVTAVIESELPESFWTGMLPQLMDTSSLQSPYFIAYLAAQARLGDKPPEVYFVEIAEQVNGDPKRYGGITDPDTLRRNFEENCLPLSLMDGRLPDYDTFLAERRRLMALRIKHWFEVLA